MIFYDVEVFKNNWLVVAYDVFKQEKTIIWDNQQELIRFYEKNKTNIWVGYNSRNYDQFIVKAIMLGMNPKVINDQIITYGKKGWEISNAFQKIDLYNFDIMTGLNSLKQLEGFQGYSIIETSVSFNIKRPLTEEEKVEVTKYCCYDVEQTIEVFIKRYEEFESHMMLLKEFKLPLKYISKTKTQLSAIILESVRIERNDEYKYSKVNTLSLTKYKHISKWYDLQENKDYEKSLEINVYGVPHIFAFGGLHGARSNYIKDGYFVSSDVASYYPSLMIEYDFLSRNVKDKSKYKWIRDRRIELKRAKNPLQVVMKLVLNC